VKAPSKGPQTLTHVPTLAELRARLKHDAEALKVAKELAQAVLYLADGWTLERETNAIQIGRRFMNLAEPTEASCVRCGKPKSDSRHIRYGADVDNPVKHEFQSAEPKETR
jgi:hypothetical protein